MRVIVAGLFVYGSLLAAVVVLAESGLIEIVHPFVLGSALGLFLIFLSVWAFMLFNSKKAHFAELESQEQLLLRLEEEGLLVSSAFHAQRGFGVEEFEDEGLHYFLELVDGRVLFLSGQYLYDYEPLSDGPDGNQPRRFPCSQFIVRRHKTEGYVVEIVCQGTVLEPETTAPPFSERVWRTGRIPEDGQLVSDMTYDECKAFIVEN